MILRDIPTHLYTYNIMSYKGQRDAQVPNSAYPAGHMQYMRI